MIKHRAFTLIEVIVATMLTGLLTTLALAPVAITVRRVVETQNEYSDMSALQRTANFITHDLAAAMRLSSNVLTVVDHEAIGGFADDVLMVMTTSTSAQNIPPGTVVYKLEEGGMLHGNMPKGLYRWIFPGKLPNIVKYDNLDPQAGQLVMPGIDEFKIEIPEGSNAEDRRKEYSGSLPQGVYMKLARNSRERQNFANADRGNSKNELETIITFP